MRDYSKVSPRFWTGETGKQIKAHGIEAQLLALYLTTSPHSNMLGLYYLPIPFICHETGLSEEGARKALRSLSEVGFCAYDEASEHVFVFKMAEWQIGRSLAPQDNRVKGIRKDFAALPNNPFLEDFLARYKDKYHLEEDAETTSPSEGPSKPGTGTGTGTGNREGKSGRFAPPSLDEVRDYCRQRGNGVDPEQWYDFYASKNWMVGKNKMKDWRAAVRTWERRNKQDQEPTYGAGGI